MKTFVRSSIGIVLGCLLMQATRCGRSNSPSGDLALLKRAVADRTQVSDDELQRVLSVLAARASQPRTMTGETIDLVLALTADAKEEIRFSTIGALTASADPRATSALERLATKDDSELVREEARSALASASTGGLK